MKNPVSNALIVAVGVPVIYGLTILGILALWTVCVMFGWNMFMPYAFHLPTLDFWHAFGAIVFVNFVIAPLYGLAKVDSKK